MGLLKVIFIFILIWYVIKLIVRYILPKAFFHFLNKQQGFGNDDIRRKRPKEGEINIKMEHSPKNQKDGDDFGEYVDFEEVEPEQKTDDE